MAGTQKLPRRKAPMEPTINKIFGLKMPPCLVETAGHNAPDPKLYYGIELEMEHASFDWEVKGFNATEDHSLRNNGVEYISVPMNYDTLLDKLKEFFHRSEASEYNYSERTSTHVHTNCQDLTIQQLKNILILYQVFEDVLFDWIGHERNKNIFCVPWSQTKLTHNILTNLEDFISASSVERNKYTALNLVPLKSKGTIEWRHLYGTCDLDVLTKWLRMIGHIYRVGRSLPYDELLDRCVNLNTTSQYDQLIDYVFMDVAPVLRVPGYRLQLENGVLNMKYSIANNNTKQKDSGPQLDSTAWLNAIEADLAQPLRQRVMLAQAGDGIGALRGAVFVDNYFTREPVQFIRETNPNDFVTPVPDTNTF